MPAEGDGEDTGGQETDESTGPEWEPYFGFDTPYDNQADAIERAIEVAREGGYLAMEGPCGTGKTMAALTAATTLVRAGEFDNVVIVTPVKQQRLQFIEDCRALNAGLEAPMEAVALVGKRDLCPFGREGVFPDDVGVHDRCEDLRENTARLVKTQGAAEHASTDTAPVASVEVGAESDGDDIWWDPQRGSDLAKHARPDGAGQQRFVDVLSTAGADSPYESVQPDAPESMTDEDGDTPLYCPFEADWYARNKGSPIGFDAGEHHVVTAADYLPESVERGTCPHRVMGVLIGNADVVIGNYNHLFDPDARPLLEAAIDDRTFLIVDEAHRLEERVRELLSRRVGRATLKRASNDLTTLISHSRDGNEQQAAIQEQLMTSDVNLKLVQETRDFYDEVLAWLDRRVKRYLDEHFEESWREDRDLLPDRMVEIPLRDPESVAVDELTEWAEREGYTGDLWRSLAQIGAAVERTIDALGINRTPVCLPVGVVMSQWWERDHARYLREIELEYAPKDAFDAGNAWEQQYNAGLVLFECMPGEALRAVFEDLGGGILMSATLEPLSVFSEVAGLNALREANRPVAEQTYDLPFPRENRASWIVDATRFTARNRGDPADNADPDTWNRTRDEYGMILRTLARSYGNVMIAMPNYREAGWAAAYLDTAIEKPVLLDQSSSNEATEDLKQDFFAGEGKVLVTSTRGTLTEGIDYDGDKLHCCAVVGIPLVNIGSPRIKAVQRAYADAFGEDRAFEYALTVPAVRRARQTIGRVIRGTDEVGVRVLVGRRYVPGARHSVFEYLSPGEREEFVRMTPEFLEPKLREFWNEQGVE